MRESRRIATVSSFLAVIGISMGLEAYANHPVLVEGNNCANGAPGTTNVPAGSCGDYDGDGLIGTAEDTDNSTDRIFGTIAAALAGTNNGANQNGRVTIVTSGRFAEQVLITGANGQVTLEAAPGVEANIDAVLSGDPGNVARQALPGVVVNAAANRRIVLRNLVIRNWTRGIEVLGSSNVTIDNCRLEGNRDYGIIALNSACVAITNSQVNGSGFRVGAAPDNNANPGIGIQFDNDSTGAIASTTVTGSFAAGVRSTGKHKRVSLCQVTSACNNPNLYGKFLDGCDVKEDGHDFVDLGGGDGPEVLEVVVPE